jgi:hypothetical protein
MKCGKQKQIRRRAGNRRPDEKPKQRTSRSRERKPDLRSKEGTKGKMDCTQGLKIIIFSIEAQASVQRIHGGHCHFFFI